MVPLGRSNRLVVAYCIEVDLHAKTGRKLKPVRQVLDSRRLLSPKMLELTRWISEHYLCPWGQTLEAVLPAGVRGQAGTRLATVLYPAEETPDLLKQHSLTTKQSKVFQALRQAEVPLTSTELCRAAKCSSAPIRKLKQLGLIRSRTVRRETTLLEDQAEIPRMAPHHLGEDQQAALSAICEPIHRGVFETLLIHGVTGSGKTEVYIRAIEEVVAMRRQAIVLVPEISLTPQTVGRFRQRFDSVAVLHSHLTDAQRHHQWQRIVSGGVQVVVGARSAVFAPVPRLGLIVLDEEHEGSFKQDTAPRYHARQVALFRARQEQVPLILGSATPSLESWQRAISGEYRLISMPRRVRNLPMPAVRTVDLRTEIASRRTRGAIHRQLHQAMRESLEAGGQVILLLNRRGFSTHIQCPACGNAMKCPHCDISLTHHRSEEIVLCHYCDHQVPTPRQCPECDFAGIRYSGLGTQKLEMEVRRRFPDVSCLRMDTDTMQGQGAHEKALASFRRGEVRILLGTQMIAKGLDFPRVTLVGVIQADTALHLPDFRASERTFHLITQVAGRTGRGDHGGRVIIQTFNPDHPAIVAAVDHDFRKFAQRELPLRQMLGYPPFSEMARIVLRGPDEPQTFAFAEHLAGRLRREFEAAGEEFRLLGPAPAPFAKLRGNYRFQLQMHTDEGELLRGVLRSTSAKVKTPEAIQWIIDLEPLDML
jgi:primosomal protein N' (replication factor Y)